jgi:hypothetical protein
MKPADSEKGTKRPFQFHPSTLFICLTVAAVAFALIGRFGVSGFWERFSGAMTIASIFAPLVEFYYWWRREEEDGW